MSSELRTAKDNLKRPYLIFPDDLHLSAYFSLRRGITRDLLGPNQNLYGIETGILIKNCQKGHDFSNSNGYEHSGFMDGFGYKFSIESPQNGQVSRKFINISGVCWLKNPPFRLLLQITMVDNLQTEAFWVRDLESSKYNLKAVIAPDGEFLMANNLKSTKRGGCVVIDESEVSKILIKKKVDPNDKRSRPIFFEKSESTLP